MPRVVFRNRLDPDNPPGSERIPVPVGRLAATGRTPIISQLITLLTGALSVVGRTPAANGAIGLPVPAGSVAFTGRAPTMSIGGGGGGGDLFTMDLSSGAQPTAGYDSTSGDSELGVVVNRTYHSTGGPGNGPYYRHTFIHDASQLNAGDGWGGEFYRGWWVDVGNAPSAGDLRYTRIRFRFSGNKDSYDSQTGENPVPMQDKILIIGDGASGRTIALLNPSHVDQANQARLHVSKDGEGNIQQELNNDTWYSLQIETKCGANGWLKYWLNADNATYSSPTGSATGLTMGTTAYTGVGVGYYANRMVTSTGTYIVEIAAFEYATTFDSSWGS